MDDWIILKRIETPAKELREYARKLAEKKGVERMVEEIREGEWWKEYAGK